MNNHNKNTAFRFHKNSRNYDENAQVQKAMAERLIGLVREERLQPLRILEIGCGTGGLTALLSRHYPNASITAVDIAPNMVRAAENKCGNEQIEFICADAESMALDQQYDLIISSACFQWFTSLPETLKRFWNSLGEGGVIAFSTFGEKTFQELHHSFSYAEAVLTGIKTCVRRGLVFQPLSFYRTLAGSLAPQEPSVQSYYEKEHRFYYPDVRSFLYSVKNIGATYTAEGTAAGPKLLREMARQYEIHYKTCSKVRATYHAQYIVWRKGYAS